MNKRFPGAVLQSRMQPILSMHITEVLTNAVSTEHALVSCDCPRMDRQSAALSWHGRGRGRRRLLTVQSAMHPYVPMLPRQHTGPYVYSTRAASCCKIKIMSRIDANWRYFLRHHYSLVPHAADHAYMWHAQLDRWSTPTRNCYWSSTITVHTASS